MGQPVWWEQTIPILEHQSGGLARICRYERPVSGRCPACAFLDGIESRMAKRFNGQFRALMTMGADYCNNERFKPLVGDGKPLWEFKEHDHRLFCYRRVTQNSKAVTIILLNGWVKDKGGRTDKEDREIKRAMGLYQESLGES